MGNTVCRGKLERVCNLFTIFTLFILFQSSFGQDQLCDLVGSTKKIGNDDVIRCLDFALLDGDTLDISSDVSSISTAGLSLCPLVDIDVMNCDIVYVLDQSKSMPTKTVAFYTFPDDTILSCNGIGRFEGPKDGDIDIPWGDSVKSVPYVINKLFMPPNNKPYRKPNWAGDPLGQSAIALHKTVEYQHAISPTSFAGFTGLHKFAAHQVPPALLNSATLQMLKDSIFIDDYEGKTEFFPSLLVAKRWLLNTTLCKNEKQMIIFISDGAPTDTAFVDHNGLKCKKYLHLLYDEHDSCSGLMPPIYGIFLGKEGAANYKPLQDLADTTGGAFHIVPPDQPDSLVGVLRSIIESSFEAPPLEITLTNESTTPIQTSTVDQSKLIQQVDGSWLLELDSALALLPGYNDLRVEINKTTKNGAKETVIHQVTLNSTEHSSELDPHFDEICYDMASLELQNSTAQTTEILTDRDTLCTLFMSHYDKHSLHRFPLTIRSLGTGDEERVLFQSKDTVPTSAPERKRMRQQFLFHSNDTAGNTAFNDTLETVAIDTIIAIWKHPRNEKDTLTDTFYVRGEEIIFEPQSAQIFDHNEDGSADSIVVTFNRTVPTLFPLKEAYWNRTSSTTKKHNATTSKAVDSTIQFCFSNNQFGFGQTGIKSSLPEDSLPRVIFEKVDTYKFPTEELPLTDRVGPIPTKAILRRSHPLHGKSDTLQITVSEKLIPSSTISDFQNFIRLVSPDDTAQDEFAMYATSFSLDLGDAQEVKLTSDSLTYLFIIKKEHAIKRGARLFLDKESKLKDQNMNSASRRSVPLEDIGVLYFTFAEESEAIDTVSPKNTPKITAHFEARSLTHDIDSLAIVISTETGDHETYYLRETTNRSGIYTKTVNIDFKETGQSNNNIIEAEFFDPFTNDTCKSSASLEWNTKTVSDSLTLLYKGIPYIEEPSLSVKNRQGNITNSIEHLDTQITVLLDLYYKINLPQYEIKIKTASHGDSETLLLKKSDSIAQNSDTLRTIMAKMIRHSSSDIIAPTAHNGTLETSSDDTLFLEWVHPTNSSEHAYDTVLVKGVGQSVDILQGTIKDLNEDGAGDAITVLFDTIVPMEFTVESAFWNKETSSCKRVPLSIKKVDNTSLQYTFSSNPFPENLTVADSEKTAVIKFVKEQEYPLSIETIQIEDGMGAVPTEAVIRAASPIDNAPDTVEVTLSEPCRLTGINSDSMILISTITGSLFETYDMAAVLSDVTNLNLTADGQQLRLEVPQKEPSFYADKNICIDTSSLQDMYDNRVTRKSVPLSYRGSLYFTERTSSDAADIFNTNRTKEIQAHLYSFSISNTPDTISLSITTDDGDCETILLQESKTESGYYTGTVSVGHGNEISPNNHIVEGAYESIVSNDTTLCAVTFSHANENQQTQFMLTYTGAGDFYTTNKSHIRTKHLSHLDSLFHINLNCDKATANSSYSVTIQSAEHGDQESLTLDFPLHENSANSDPLRLLLSRAVGFISSDITRPISQNGRVEASAADTLYLTCLDVKSGITYKDTLTISGIPIKFTPLKTVILDTNENGIADKLATTYNHPIPEPFIYKALYWNNSSVTPIVQLTTQSTFGTTDTLTWQEQGGISTGIPASLSQEEQPLLLLGEHDFLKFTTLQSPVSDGIGAVPLDAKLLCSHRGTVEPDTLIVTTSEPIIQSSITALSPVRSCLSGDVTNPLSAISGYESSRTIPSLTPFTLTNDQTITLFPSKDNPDLLKGSYVFLNKESGGTDLVGNAHARKRVALKRYEKLYFSLPENPDSLITFVEWPNHGEVLATLPVVSTNDAVLETILLALTLPTGDMETVQMTETTPSSGVFTATVPIGFHSIPTPQNGVLEGQYQSQDQNDSDTLIATSTTPDGIVSTSKLPMHYNAPPRIKRALYYASALDADTPDTVRIFTNVPVIWPAFPHMLSESIFDYWDGLLQTTSISTASLLQENLMSGDTTATILIPRENALTPLLDSIRFIAGCSVVQTEKGIHPIESAYTVLEYGATPPIEIRVVPNPFLPKLSQLPDVFSRYVPNAPETAVGIRVRTRLKLQRAQYTLFDAVNNVVLPTIPLFVDESLNEMYGVWDGKNKSNRYVGDGAYLAIVTIVDIYGQRYEEKVLIGVKESYIPKYTMPWD